MEIKEVTKGDKKYKNIDFRNLNYGVPETVTLVFDKPMDITTQYGLTQLFMFMYNDVEVSSLLNNGLKSNNYGVSLGDALKSFKRGDMISITKQEGKTKAGKIFRYFELTKVGENVNLPIKAQINNIEQIQKSAPQINLVMPNLAVNNAKKEPVLSDWEKAIYEGIKTRNDITNEQRIQLFVQNSVQYSRAKEIVEALFK